MIIVKKIIAIVAVFSLFVVGGALAFNGGNGISSFGEFGRGMTHMSSLTGRSLEDIAELKGSGCIGGTSMIDSLKEEGLYDEWKENMLKGFEEQLAYQVENERITEEEAVQLLEDLSDRIEEGPPFAFGHVMGRGRNNSKSYRSNR
jgi:hypothetical protein